MLFPPLYSLDNLSLPTQNTLILIQLKHGLKENFISRHIISEDIWFPMVLFLPKRKMNTCFVLEHYVIFMYMHALYLTINYLFHFHYKLQKQDIFWGPHLKIFMLSLASKQSLCVIDLWSIRGGKQATQGMTVAHKQVQNWFEQLFFFKLVVNIYKLEDFV